MDSESTKLFFTKNVGGWLKRDTIVRLPVVTEHAAEHGRQGWEGLVSKATQSALCMISDRARS